MGELTEAMAQIIATNIKTLRLSLGQDQTEFADTMDVGQSTVSKWENGSTPNPAKLIELAEKAGVTVPEFTNWLLPAPSIFRNLGKLPAESQPLMLPVLFPSEQALAAMFRSLLRILAGESDQAVVAQRLAQLLPDALSQIVFRPGGAPLDEAEAEPLASAPQLPVGTNSSRR